MDGDPRHVQGVLTPNTIICLAWNQCEGRTGQKCNHYEWQSVIDMGGGGAFQRGVAGRGAGVRGALQAIEPVPSRPGRRGAHCVSQQRIKDPRHASLGPPAAAAALRPWTPSSRIGGRVTREGPRAVCEPAPRYGALSPPPPPRPTHHCLTNENCPLPSSSSWPGCESSPERDRPPGSTRGVGDPRPEQCCHTTENERVMVMAKKSIR